MAFLEVAGGALIGGGVSLGTTLLVEARKVKADLQKEDRIQSRELLQALRLVESECRFNLSSLTVIQERDKGPWFPPDLPISTKAWQTHQAVIALYPDQGLWHLVDVFFASLMASEHVNKSEETTEAAKQNLDTFCVMAKKTMEALQKAVEEVA